MIAEVEAARPRFLVDCAMPGAWLAHRGSHAKIERWAQAYADLLSTLAGIVDIVSAERAVYRLGSELAGHVPVSENFTAILERKD